MTEPHTRSDRILTVQGWLNLVLSVMGLVVLAGGVATVLLLGRSDQVTEELTEDIGPARIAAYQLQAALRDQETAVRGYLIAADRQFLAPTTTVSGWKPKPPPPCANPSATARS